MHLKAIFSLFFLLLVYAHAFSQRYYPYAMSSRELIGVHTGLTGYFGDLQAENQFINQTATLGLSYEYLIGQHVSFRSQFSWYQLKASDEKASQPDIVARNLSFHANNFEGSFNAVFWLKPNGRTLYSKRSKYNAYALAGLGLTYFTPKATLEGQEYKLRPLETEGNAYGKWALVVPIGGGLTIKLNDKMDLAAELSYRFTSTDYLDDVSTRYLNNENISDPIRKRLADRRQELGLEPVSEGSVRGNPSIKDSYAFYCLRLHYRISRAYYRGKNIQRKIAL